MVASGIVIPACYALLDRTQDGGGKDAPVVRKCAENWLHSDSGEPQPFCFRQHLHYRDACPIWPR